jgi:hypothetical protein
MLCFLHPYPGFLCGGVKNLKKLMVLEKYLVKVEFILVVDYLILFFYQCIYFVGKFVYLIS